MKKNLLTVAVLTVVAMGCAPSLRVNVLQPAPINFGAAKHLSIVQSEGRRSAKEFLIAELISQGRAGGYFTVADRTDEGISVKVAGRSVNVSGGSGPAQTSDVIGLRVDVLDWNNSKDLKTLHEKDSKGNPVDRIVARMKARVLLAVTGFNAQGKALLAEKEFTGTIEADPDQMSDEAALQFAGRQAVSQILSTITPSTVEKWIRLDGDDELQKPIIEMARGGNIPRAIIEERELLARHPSPASEFNLAVLLDASGQYQEALEHYGNAANGSPKEFYGEMKTECGRRLADQQALSQ